MNRERTTRGECVFFLRRAKHIYDTIATVFLRKRKLDQTISATRLERRRIVSARADSLNEPYTTFFPSLRNFSMVSTSSALPMWMGDLW